MIRKCSSGGFLVQEDLLLPLRGVSKGWEPKRQENPEGGCLPGSKRSEKPQREALHFQIGRAISAPSGERPSPHNALGREPAARNTNKGMRGMRRRSSHPAHTEKRSAKGVDRSSDTPANEKNATAQGNPRSPKSEVLTDGQQ
ncbi:hypothetical protein NDU88_007853 [Pleurodeles waltl]|uniref:Uncharacterized protein n=1 Tax=Pleurodeles waltl TaxID=8319 RepID=A0AAV7SU43_PLEWA|nr:hypothetical protein NDU88_007853 [Pleurodeles waltl]